MLNMHELNVFVEAAQTENFSVAAHRLYLSQPAVSLQVRNLEKQLGVELFRRHGRNVVLSDAGKVLLPMAQQLLLQAKHIEEVMWGLQGMVIGQLTIACSTTVGKYVLPQLISNFRKHFPEVQVIVQVMSRRVATDWLLEGGADLAVVSSHIVHRDLDYESFLEDQVVLIVPCSHPWADGRTITPAELLESEYLMREPTAGSYEVLSERLATAGLSIANLKVAMTLGNAEAIEMAVEADLGIAFVSRFVAARGLSMGRVAEVPIEGLDLNHAVYMVRHARRPATPPQQAFWDYTFDPINEDMRRLPKWPSAPRLELAS